MYCKLHPSHSYYCYRPSDAAAIICPSFHGYLNFLETDSTIHLFVPFTSAFSYVPFFFYFSFVPRVKVLDMHTEDARRIVLRAANCSGGQRSPRGHLASVPSPGSKFVPPPPPQIPQPGPPLTSTGSTSSTSSSSGYGSVNGISQVDSGGGGRDRMGSPMKQQHHHGNDFPSPSHQHHHRSNNHSQQQQQQQHSNPQHLPSNLNGLENEFHKVCLHVSPLHFVPFTPVEF